MAAPSFSTEQLNEWRAEKDRLQKLVVETQQRLHAVNMVLNAATVLTEQSDTVAAVPESPATTEHVEKIDPTNVMGTLARLINESPKPLQRAELKEAAAQAGVDPEKLNGPYFHVALNRMKEAKRITIRDDGSVWRGDRRL